MQADQIPAEIVEAAAATWYGMNIDVQDGWKPSWEEVSTQDAPYNEYATEAREHARVALAASWPLIERKVLTDATEETTVTSDCVFCQIIWGTSPGKIIREWADAIALTPLTPVIHGHVLIIPKHHVAHAATDESITARTMGRAAEYATQYDSFNIITSAGRAATQSIDHLHIHVVPRTPDDQLMTPWGTIYGDDPTAPHWCRQAQELSERLNGMT